MTSLVACLPQYVYVIVWHQIGEEGKQLTLSYVYRSSDGSDVSLPFVYVDTKWFSHSGISFDSKNEFMRKRVFRDDLR